MSRQSSTKAPQPQGKRPAQSSQQPTQSPQASMKKRSRPSLGWSVKKFWRGNWLWLIGIALILLIGFSAWYGSRGSSSPAASLQAMQAAASSVAQATSTLQATPTPAGPITPVATGNWRMVQTFTGSDTGQAEQKTKTFAVTGNWQITWACQGQNGVADTLYVSIYNPDGSLYNAGAQVTCIADKQVVGSVAEANGGTFFLKINANTPWTVTVQEQK